MRELRREFPEWSVEQTRGNHLRLRHRSGAVVFTGLTPSCWRADREMRADMRRALAAARARKQ